MREIKFRCWDKKNSRFIEGGSVIYRLYAGGEGIMVDINEQGYDNGENRQNDFVVLQYTGLHDKNGVPIFEGDIIRSKEGKFGYVVYLETNCRFIVLRELVGYTVPQYQFELAFPREPEVIGNKWEHPDLLK